jgi:hypothetical protein
LLVGGQAVIYYTEPRYTKDLDVWVIPELNKAAVVYAALKDFGANLKGMTPENFENKNMIFQMGLPPVRIDIMLDVNGIGFEKAWKNRKNAFYGKTPIQILGRDELIFSKLKTARPQDLIDAQKIKMVSTVSDQKSKKPKRKKAK